LAKNRAATLRDAGLNNQKFFVSFFSKKKYFLASLARGRRA
jgi:hypothetical protein